MKLLSLLTFIIAIPVHASVCDVNNPQKKFQPKYAKHFDISYFKNYKIITVDQEKYLLANGPVDCIFSETKIKTPVKNVAMMSTTYLPALVMLNKEKTLKAFQDKKYIVSNAFDLENIQELSFKFNPEDLLKLKSDLIMGYSSNLSTPNQQHIFHTLKIPVVINNDFEEKTPLARAEWLIFTASFFNEEEKAIGLFKQIEKDYLLIKKQNQNLKKAEVLVGDIQAGFWVTCGGESDLAQLITDAGGELAFSKASSNTQNISLEEVYQKKNSYDVWLPNNMWESEKEKSEALARDPRYKFIKASRIFNNNLILNKYKSSDYWETALQRPDLLLKDLSALFHPDIYKKHTLQWYRQL
jgi:iron complex transport system substrate-binding protein